MALDAIVLGEPETLLRRGPADLEDPASWTKRDSDILAHFLQVHSQLRRSSWYAEDKEYTSRGDDVTHASMPDLEQFVFAAVYFRQFTMQKDSLFRDAADRYCSHVACPIRRGWVKREADAFHAQLDSTSFPLSAAGLTYRQLFDAFMYGASLMHKIPEEHKAHRRRFLDVYDNQPRAQLLYALNVGMLTSLNYVGHAALVIYQDYAHWQLKYSLPLPDVRWHDRLLDVETATME